MNLFLNKRSIKELETPAVVATKNDARTQKVLFIFSGLLISGFFWLLATKFRNEFAQGGLKILAIACGYIGFSNHAVVNLQVPIGGLTDGAPHAVRTFV